MKLRLTITDVAAFLKQDYYSCFSLYMNKTGVSDWVDCGEIEIDIDGIDTSGMVKIAKDEIDASILNLEGKIEHLKTKRAELFALPYSCTEQDDDTDGNTAEELDAEESRIMDGDARDYCTGFLS
jgi:hypothetical protein